MIRVLIADDEERWRRLLGDFLRNEGYQVDEAADGLEAVELARRYRFDLVLLDIMMPRMDGIAACKLLRTFTHVPVIIVTARSGEESELEGFDCGADDFVSKPFRFPVLMARIRALLKRTGSVNDAIDIAGLHIDPASRTVTVDEKPCQMTPREFELLLYLAQNKNQALSRQQILTAVWEYDYYGDARTVDTHVKNLRTKLGRYGDLVKTVRGRGYRMEV